MISLPKPTDIIFIYWYYLRRAVVAMRWILKPIDGYILFHSSDYFNITFNAFDMEDFPLFKPGLADCYKDLPAEDYPKFLDFFKEIHEEYLGEKDLRFRKICSLINMVYIELSRVLLPSGVEKNSGSRAYYESLKKFENRKKFQKQKISQRICRTVEYFLSSLK